MVINLMNNDKLNIITILFLFKTWNFIILFMDLIILLLGMYAPISDKQSRSDL